MSNTILEMIRSKNEEIEHLEKALVKAIAFKENNSKERVTAEYIIKRFIEDIQKRSADLLDIYSDKDGLRKEEIDILAGNKNYLESNLNLLNNQNLKSTQSKAPDVWYNFYQKLREIKIMNKRNLNTNEVNENTNYEKLFNTALDELNSKSIFTSEENKGRCVDMNNLYLKYLNFKKLREPNFLPINDYLSFLSEFDKFYLIPLYVKKTNKYKEYISSIYDYLQDYFRKTNPLLDYSEIEVKIQDEFEKEWKEGTLFGWEKVIKSFKKDIDNLLNNDSFDENHKNANGNTNNNNNTSDELTHNQNSLGVIDPLYCLACKKKFANISVFEHHKNGKTHLKNLEKLNKESDDNNKTDNILFNELEFDIKEEETCKGIAMVEYFILRFKDLLSNTIENTKNMIRKKQSMTYDEMEADIVDDKEIDLDIVDEEDKPVYNPKNVPIGWDGKPIPYWLYKLHGLGMEFKCEICGGASYWGRKAFERHFQEWRHSYGMKCLKIPNTIHFREVTGIEDALRLHQSLIEKSKKKEFKPEVEEEFEDSEGNVLNKKMYLDLQRQGLL
jgi:splicing factor 3A subunit 3